MKGNNFGWVAPNNSVCQANILEDRIGYGLRAPFTSTLLNHIF